MNKPMPTPTDCRKCGRPYYGAAGLLCDKCEREAKRPLDAAACSEARAEVTKRITGRIASIEVGEIVKVTQNDGKTCTVERETWRGSLVEINNRVVGAPVNHLKFRPQNDLAQTRRAGD
jgi:hypothetical protein